MANTNIATLISQIETDRNTIRAKLSTLGIASSTAKLTECATAINNITDCGAVSATVKEGETYTIPKGFHDGAGTVSGVAGGGNYSLQSKTITPTKTKQTVTADSGYYGISDVVINPIPDAYQDVTSVTAIAADVLANKVFVDSDGVVTAGTMANNGAVTKTLNTSTTSYTIPQGYHSGAGKVSITTETKTATPTEAAQNITPTSGKVLSKVTVNPIPSNYKNISGVTATADKVLAGSSFIGSDGVTTEGTIPVKGEENVYLTTTNPTLTIPKGYYDGEKQKVYVSSKTQTVTPTKSAQTLKGNQFFSEVTVNPIPDAYQDVTEVTATESVVLDGFKFVDSTGAVKEGTIINHGIIGVNKELDGMTATVVTIPAGFYPADHTVTLTSSIEEALAAI